MTRFISRLALVAVFVAGGAASALAMGPGGPGGPQGGGMRPGGQSKGMQGQGRPPGHKSAKFSGGGGESWKSGKDQHGFMGSYGGCRYKGFAGPGGYKLDKSC